MVAMTIASRTREPARAADAMHPEEQARSCIAGRAVGREFQAGRAGRWVGERAPPGWRPDPSSPSRGAMAGSAMNPTAVMIIARPTG
jgi:hypothetical protein